MWTAYPFRTSTVRASEMTAAALWRIRALSETVAPIPDDGQKRFCFVTFLFVSVADRGIRFPIPHTLPHIINTDHVFPSAWYLQRVAAIGSAISYRSTPGTIPSSRSSDVYTFLRLWPPATRHIGTVWVPGYYLTRDVLGDIIKREWK